MIRICTSLADTYDVILVGRQRKTSIPMPLRGFQDKRIRCIFDKGKLFYVEYNIRLFFYLLFRRFDAVCAIDLDTILPAYYISKLKRKPCVYDAHEYFTELPEVISRPKVKRIWGSVANRTIPNLKYCYTVCASLSEVFEKEYGTPFEVIRNVPFKKKKKKLKKVEIPILLYQGVLNEGRGLAEMITAMVEIKNAKLWLVGEGDLSDELRELSKELAVEDRVRFLGFVQPDELHEITPQASIGLNLLENQGLNYYYSLANKAFDYIQSGIPAIQMNFPEYQKINEQFEVAILIDNLKTETIVAAVNKLLEEEKFYIRLVDNCKKAAKTFVWEEESQKLLKFYKDLFASA